MGSQDIWNSSEPNPLWEGDSVPRVSQALTTRTESMMEPINYEELIWTFGQEEADRIRDEVERMRNTNKSLAAFAKTQRELQGR